MPGQTSYYSFIHVWNEPIFWDYEFINWTTVENQLYGLYTFVGNGIVSGWDVLAVSEEEVEALSDEIKQSLIHTSYCMMFKVTAGDGIIGVYAAYTPEDVYKSIEILPQSGIYYVYAVRTDCLPSQFRADILLTTDSDYDSSHQATYLATIITYYDPDFGETYIYRIYDENYRRRVLKNLEGPSLEAIREEFYRHVHIGIPDTEYQVAIDGNPSKIVLGQEDIENLTVIPSSPIFIINQKFALPKDFETTDNSIINSISSLPKYEKVEIKVNGNTISENDYYLENLEGKLYLKNSVNTEDIVQIVKFKDVSIEQIARGQQDDPITTFNKNVVVSVEDKYLVDDRYKLPKNRVVDIDASKIVFGTLPITRINPIDHYGMNRIRESASIDPRTSTRTKDQTTYYFVPPEDVILGYDSELFYLFNSTTIGQLVSLTNGLYKVKDENYQELEKLDFQEDRGRVIKIFDNNIEGDHGGGYQFPEVYVLTDMGEIWYSQDSGLTWSELQVPATQGLFVNCFSISTDKVERIVKNRKTWDYYKIMHIGTNLGLFSARFLAAKGTVSGSTEPIITTTIPWVYNTNIGLKEILSLQEVITGHSRVTETDSSYWYDRSLYIGTDQGFYNSNRLVKNALNIIIKDSLWAFNNTALLCLSIDNKAYITHTFSHIQTDDGTVAEDYWKHALSEEIEELHISYDFTTVSKNINILSQEFGRNKYFIGLNSDIAISSLDSQIDNFGHTPFLFGKIYTSGEYGLSILNGKISISGSDLGISSLKSSMSVISLANAADELARTDAEKEIGNGWNPLLWDIPNTDMLDTKNLNFNDKLFVEYSAIYGSQQQPTDYYSSSSNGVWKSSDGGLTWGRTISIWPSEVIPYVERNDIAVNNFEYSLNHNLQAIIFNSQQDVSDKIMIEKDFKEYFAVNGKWEQSNVDLVVYLDGTPTYRPFTYNKDLGLITFTDSLEISTNVSLSLVDVGTYISNIGTIPHSEVLDAFIANEDVYTELTQDLQISDNKIKVLNNYNFPNSYHYIKINDEKIYVKKIDQYTFETVGQRSNTQTHLKKDIVYWLEVKRQYGLDDYVSIMNSGQTYNIFSVYVSNLLRGQIAKKHIYEDVFNGVPHIPEPSVDSTVYQGLRQSLIHVSGQDAMDDANSISTLWNGLDIPSRIEVSTPKIITSMKNAGTYSFTVGTERGVWRYNGINWNQLSDLDGASIVYYIEYDRRGYLVVGADNGLWISQDDGVNWQQSSVLYEEQLSFKTGTLSWWSPSKKYEIYGKNNGISMSVYGWDSGHPESFKSDHFDDVDGNKVYGLYQGIFYRIDEETGQKKTYDSIWLMTENGLWLCYTGTRYRRDGSANPYSAILKGVEPIDPGIRTETTETSEGDEITTIIQGEEGDLSADQRYIKVGIDDNEEDVYEKLRFYGAFQDSRPKTTPIIFLTNDGLRVARNWRWVDPEDLSIYLQWEAKPLYIDNSLISGSDDHLKRIICSCFTTGTDTTIDDDDVDSWKKYKCFIGTNKGIYRSYNGCYDVEACQKISNVSSIYCLNYESGTLYAGTNNGVWYSINDGDDWFVLSTEVSNADYITNTALISQTFIPVYNEITKIGLYLHPKGE